MLPESLKAIGTSAFEKCSGIVEVINNSSLELRIGEKSNGFVAYYSLNVTDGSNCGTFNKLDDYTFYNFDHNKYLVAYTGTSSRYDFPDSYQNGSYEIAPYAFFESSVTTINIPLSITKIGKYAFGGCEQLRNITYDGSKAEWASIEFEEGNEVITKDAWIYFKGEVQSASDPNRSIGKEIASVFSDLLTDYMFFLNFIFTLIWGLVLLYAYYRNDTEKAYIKRKKIFVIIVCIQWILISGLRANSVGADTVNYMTLFEEHRNWSWPKVLTGLFTNFLSSAGSGTSDYEPGYILLEKIIGSFTSNQVLYKMIIAIIFMSAFGYYIYHNSVDPCLSFVIYDGLFYNMFSLTGYRQTVSVAIAVLYGYKFIKSRKLIPFIVTVLVAALFHRSILIMLPFYFLANKKQTIRYVGGAAAVVVAMIVFRNPLFNFVKVMVGYEQYSGTYGFAQQTFVLLLVVLTATIYYFKDQILAYNETAVQYYNGLILAWTMVPFAIVSPTSMRLVYNFAFVLVLIVPTLVSSFRKPGNRYLVYWAIVLLFGYFIFTRSPSYMFYWQEIM